MTIAPIQGQGDEMERGHMQKIKSAAEEDVLYNRRLYCYLINHSPVHKIKKQMSRRLRRELKQELKDIL